MCGEGLSDVANADASNTQQILIVTVEPINGQKIFEEKRKFWKDGSTDDGYG